MPEPRFQFLTQPLHDLQARLTAELARNPYLASARPDPGGEDRRADNEEGPANPSSDE